MPAQPKALTRSQVAAIQDSFTRIAPKAGQVATDFYKNLFTAHPEVRALFPDDMAAQKEKLVGTLAYVVKGLGNVSDIQKAVRDLGVRHRGYRATPKHYEAVGAALLTTLQTHLGPKWTPELKDAWATAYQFLSTTMIEAAAARADR